MKAIRVLVANCPRLIRELILSTISEQPDIEIVGEVPEESDIDRGMELARPDFLIVDLKDDDQVTARCRQILHKYPTLKIIAIPAGRNTTMCYWAVLEVRSKKIEASENSLLELLRAG